MALSYKARRRWSLIILLAGLPIYIIIALNVAVWLGEVHKLIELLVYVVLGVVWALPVRAVFKGVGQADPEVEE